LIQQKAITQPRTRRRYSALAIFAFISLTIILSWRYYSKFQWHLFFQTLTELDPRWVAGGTVLALASYLGRAARWKVMMLPARSSLPRLISATLMGFSAVVLLGRAGEVVRPILIARQEKSTVPAQVAIWLMERLYDLLLILVLFGIGLSEAGSLSLAPNSRLTPVLRVGGGLVGLAAGGASALLYVLGRHPGNVHTQLLRVLSFLPDRILCRVSRTFDSFLHGARSIGRPKVLAASLALTIGEWAVILAAVWCYFHADPASRGLRLLDVAVYLGFVSVGNIVQLPGIGGGVQIASIIVLTELFHMHVEVAIGLSLLVWAGSALIVLPLGIPLAIAGHVKLFEIRQNGSCEQEGASGGEQSADQP
jgi:hypothetical protein